MKVLPRYINPGDILVRYERDNTTYLAKVRHVNKFRRFGSTVYRISITRVSGTPQPAYDQPYFEVTSRRTVERFALSEGAQS